MTLHHPLLSRRESLSRDTPYLEATTLGVICHFPPSELRYVVYVREEVSHLQVTQGVIMADSQQG